MDTPVAGHIGTKMTGGCVAMIYPMMLGYVASGQLTGYLDSSRGAAEFELLSKNPGEAIITMDAQSIGHIIAVVARAQDQRRKLIQIV